MSKLTKERGAQIREEYSGIKEKLVSRTKEAAAE